VKRRYLAKTPARRTVTAVAGGIALAALTSGCAVFNPVQTNVPYVPADGVPADVGQLAIRNLALVDDGSGQMVVAGSAINLGTEDLSVRLAPQVTPDSTDITTGSELSLGPREQLDMGTKGLAFGGVTSKAGSVIKVTVTSTPGGTTVVTVPVLTAVGYYSTLTPAPTGTAAPTATPTPTPTGT
jgi:hypothetical protein